MGLRPLPVHLFLPYWCSVRTLGSMAKLAAPDGSYTAAVATMRWARLFLELPQTRRLIHVVPNQLSITAPGCCRVYCTPWN